jgi:TIR domain
LPGQEWELEIRKAVRNSDAVIVCLSRSSITQRGYVQKEIKYALDIADEQPEGNIFLIPVKLEECEVPSRLRDWHWVNLFEDSGYRRLTLSLNNCGRSQLIKKHTKSAHEQIESPEHSPGTAKQESSGQPAYEEPSKRKIEEYDAETQEIAFTLEIFEYPEEKEFVGQLSGHKPALLQEVKRGEPYPVLRLIPDEKITADNKDQLIEYCKTRMEELGGRIAYFTKLQ